MESTAEFTQELSRSELETNKVSKDDVEFQFLYTQD